MAEKIMQLLGRLSAGALALVTTTAMAVTVVVMGLAGPKLLTGTERYPDIVVGEITFADAYKHGDLLASFAVVAVFSLIWWVLALLLAWRRSLPTETEEFTGQEAGPLWLLALFPCYFAGVVLIRKDGGIVELGVSLLLVAGGLLHRLRRESSSDRQIVFSLLAGIVTAAGMFFSTLALIVAAKFFFPQALLERIPERLPLLLGGVGLCAALFPWRLPERSLTRAAHAAQLLTPLLLLAGFSRVYQGPGWLTPNLLSLPVKGVIVVVIGLFVAATVRQYLLGRALVTVEPRDLLLRPAVMAVAAFLAFTMPAYLERDFFHAGELFLTWHQVFEKGQFPFSGFAVARGFGDAVISLVNVLFFDGNYATFTFAVPVYAMVISALNALLFCSLLGNGWGAVLAIAAAAAPYCNVSLFLPVFLLLVQPKLLARPLAWLSAWLLLSVGLCLYHTTNGIALTAGTLPVAAWVCHGAIKGGYFREAWQVRRSWVIGVTAILVLVLLLLSPLLVAWLTYVRDQGGVNELANGTLLLNDLALPSWFRWQNRWIFEGVRIGGWVVGCFLLWHLLAGERLRRVRQGNGRLPVTAEALALAGIAATVAFIPYSMGRIDGKGLSRTGSVAMLVLCIMVPMVMLLISKRRRGGVLCGTAFLIGVGAAAYYESPAALARKALAAVTVPANAQLIDGARLGLGKVGKAFMDGEMLTNLQQLKSVTDRFVRPGESYLDLTNHVGFYYLLDYRVPSLYAGYYIVTSETLQKKVIAALAKNPPPMVLAGPVRTFGSGTAALRSYRLYRWLLLQGYVPVDTGGFAVLVRPDRYRELYPILPPPDEQSRLLAAIFGEDFFAGIPLAWGKNMDLLASRFRQGTVNLGQTSRMLEYAQLGAGVVPLETFQMATSEPINGADHDFLLLKQLGAGVTGTVRISWREGGDGEWRAVGFDAKPGIPLLVPLGSHPGWLLARNIRDLKFELVGIRGAEAFPFEPVFLKLIK